MKTKLNYISKSVMVLLLFVTNVFSQSITNTLGTNGLFTIKDASNNYLTLSQSSGQLNILKTLRFENTTSSSTGIIFKGLDRFLHNFGTNNTFLGINSGNFSLTNASENIGVGRNSLLSLTTGDGNIAIGYASLKYNTMGNANTATGFFSLEQNTTGTQNTAFGYSSLSENVTGGSNTSVGYGSLKSNTIGTQNTALGYQSLNLNTTGNFNTALGLNTLGFNTIGSLNTAVGYSAGSIVTTGVNLTLIGNNAEPTSGAANNQITLGNSSVSSLRCNVQTITSLSDARDKKNITDLSLGLDFLMKVKPRTFNWDKRDWYENNISDGTKTQETPTAGFIAQELDEVQTNENADWLNLVLKDNPEKLEATYGNLLPVMVKAIQELKVECEKLKIESDQLKNESIKMKQDKDKLLSEIESLELMKEKIVKLEKILYEITANQQTSLTGTEVNITNSK